MATIKPIEGKSVHQIQSGQVISDGLTSVVKELVENSFDAHATSIEVRFKNYGLDSVEVVDNGVGITPSNYESIALKHWTSKLTSYDDLDTVTTFGFRGEALSSLCALSDLQVITATADEAPKGTRLEFETSGKLKSRSVAAAQRGTTVLVENIFKTLPVRRKELERNIKREYAKVLGILQAYAGICVGVKFSVFNQPPRGRRTPAFATKGNPTTRENIANVFGAKTLSALVALDLQFDMKPTRKVISAARTGGSGSKEIKIVGHISRPVVGEGRQAPDRQMFFVNGRPCVLPQISRAFNEVYKSFNVTQSPFIFADIQMDTNAYDVNVSPDKRSILLHDQTELLESLKDSLIRMFTNHEQTIPLTKLGTQAKVPTYKQLTFNRPANLPAPSSSSLPAKEPQCSIPAKPDSYNTPNATRQSTKTTNGELDLRAPNDKSPQPTNKDKAPQVYTIGSSTKTKVVNCKPPTVRNSNHAPEPANSSFTVTTMADEISDDILIEEAEEFDDSEVTLPPLSPTQHPIPPIPSAMTSPFSKLSYRSPRRSRASKTTITIGDRNPVTTESSPPSSPSKRRKVATIGFGGSKAVEPRKFGQQPRFSSGMLGQFAAPGAQVESKAEEGNKIDDEEIEGFLEEDIMILDEDEYPDEDLTEVFRGTSQVEERFGNGEDEETGDISDEQTSLGQDDSTPLFLPNPELSGDEPTDDETHKEAGEEIESMEDAKYAEDEDFLDESESLKQSSVRAQKLLEEAEAAAQPTPKGLEKAFQILEGSTTNSTKYTTRTYSISIPKIRQQSKALLQSFINLDTRHTSFNPAQIEDDVSAEARLNLAISKKDFLEMQVKGQFNKGFILATRKDDLFIIDQHASDEKYNFEKLQQETVVQNQRLVIPKTLELMAMEEVIVIEHLNIFKKNGFVIEVNPEAPTGSRCKLVSLPLSKEIVFGIKDLEELIHLVHENQGNTSVRCSKIRSMFAMRACKKSTKVGRALTIKGMEKIVRHMGELDKPWNCPHGRPTMRHLTELNQIVCWNEYDSGQGGLGGLQWSGQNWADTWLAVSCVGNEDGNEGYGN